MEITGMNLFIDLSKQYDCHCAEFHEDYATQ
jgi:hypothetical protein